MLFGLHVCEKDNAKVIYYHRDLTFYRSDLIKGLKK